ncbi:GtrA family protein [Porticoccus sp.]
MASVAIALWLLMLKFYWFICFGVDVKKKCKNIWSKFDPRLARYIFAGGANTFIAYLLFAFFLYVGINYTLSTLFAGVITVIYGYHLNKTYVFNVKSANFIKYILLFSSVYILNISIQTVLLEFESNKYFAGFVATFMCALTSFILFRWLVFNEKKV